ncbi:hypothetical protein JB92DRAFT_359183 [Gautieria morchelliformis]|nr:hypothetical protein JB92DRAFT_359183 [Gautieria morchelliformis]
MLHCHRKGRNWISSSSSLIVPWFGVATPFTLASAASAKGKMHVCNSVGTSTTAQARYSSHQHRSQRELSHPIGPRDQLRYRQILAD